MNVRSILAALAVLAAVLVAPVTVSSADAAILAPAHVAAAKHACTKQAGTCIKRGQKCPRAKKGKVGWDNRGRKNVCRGKGAHPHWRKPAGKKTVGHHACTRTSSGTCIQGGQFCPQAKYGKSGWDAKGRRYVCKGDHTHPHWMKP